MLTAAVWAIPRRALNVVRGVVQRHGTAAVKRRLWDWEFDHGRWACLDDTPDDPAYPYLAQYAMRGRILDLGCGPGNVGRHLDPDVYSEYVGVDISQSAVDKARTNNARPHNTYFQSDVLTYRPDGTYNVILLGDSLYYIPRPEIPGMLTRYRQYLSERGVFIVKLHDAAAYQPLFEIIRGNFRVLAEHRHGPVGLVIFRTLMITALSGGVLSL